MTVLTPLSVSSRKMPPALTDADVFAVLRKTWQPVCTLRDLRARKIVSYTLLGDEIVIADLPDGLLAARDLCPHRGAKFGLGSIVGGHLQCPYHGWEFAHTGRCAKVPSLIDPFAPLDKSCLRTFAVQERYGMVWVRLDALEAAPLPDVPEYEDAAWTYVVADPMPFGTGFRREIDNYLDMSHFAFAHRDTLGVAARSQISDITITHFEDGFRMDAPFPVLSNPSTKPGKLQQSHHRRQRCFLPNFTTIRQSFHDGDERVLVHIPSPNTPTSCTVFWALAVSPNFDGPSVEQQMAFAVRVLDEDRVMVENQRPLEVPIGAEEAVMVPADRLANTYKAALRDFVLADVAPPAGEVIDTGGGQDKQTITILYGSQTGTAERLASVIDRTLKRAGFEPTVHVMQDVSPSDLHGNVLILTSTYGNGEPPDNARTFFDAAFENDALDCSDVRFAVLALGDRTYPNFCQCGRELDERLEALGARRLLSRVDCDVAFDAAFAEWLPSVQRAFRKGKRQDVVALLDDDLPPGYGAARPVSANVVENRLLSLIGSEKETRHYEVDVRESGLVYDAGDALGIVPTNSPELVAAVIERLSDPAGRMTEAGKTLEQALLTDVELRRPSFALLREIARQTGDADLLRSIETSERTGVREYGDADIVDLLDRPGRPALTGQQLIDLSDRIRPRLYSIASSPRVHPGSIHLTVSTVRYRRDTRVHHGAASTFLADRVERHTPVPVYLHRNTNFRLPADPATDIIMIGPGTGIAPFRAFLYEREAASATGRNWLFFGDHHAATDFLYEKELLRWRDTGVLTRLDTAFSRDQPEKIYVQHRIREQAAAVFEWIERGAVLYVCGDSRRMAHDVDHALHDVIAAGMNQSIEDTRGYVKHLQLSGRYKRDVY